LIVDNQPSKFKVKAQLLAIHNEVLNLHENGPVSRFADILVEVDHFGNGLEVYLLSKAALTEGGLATVDIYSSRPSSGFSTSKKSEASTCIFPSSSTRKCCFITSLTVWELSFLRLTTG